MLVSWLPRVKKERHDIAAKRPYKASLRRFSSAPPSLPGGCGAVHTLSIGSRRQVLGCVYTRAVRFRVPSRERTVSSVPGLTCLSVVFLRSMKMLEHPNGENLISRTPSRKHISTHAGRASKFGSLATPSSEFFSLLTLSACTWVYRLRRTLTPVSVPHGYPLLAWQFSALLLPLARVLRETHKPLNLCNYVNGVQMSVAD